MSDSSSSSSGVGVSGLLLVAFVVLKLTKVIDWSWWWVLSPAWIPLCIFIVGALIFLVYWFVFKKHKNK